jgi:hypothetical protein
MGASPVVSSTPLLQKEGYKVVGVIILDVVEGDLDSSVCRALLTLIRHRRWGFAIDEEHPLPTSIEI